MLKYNKKLEPIARTLRKNMTDAEILLWSKIKRKQIKEVQFYRQKPIGNYIADFYCSKEKLIIEVDGGQHYEEKGIKKDKVRDEYFKSLGLKVLRFTNIDVLKNINGVLEKIYEEVWFVYMGRSLCSLLLCAEIPPTPFYKGGANFFKVLICKIQ